MRDKYIWGNLEGARELDIWQGPVDKTLIFLAFLPLLAIIVAGIGLVYPNLCGC